MALDNAAADAVAAQIAADIAALPKPTASSTDYLQAVVRRIFAGIVANAEVSTTVQAGTTANGVTAGGASVPVTGTTAGTVA